MTSDQSPKKAFPKRRTRVVLTGLALSIIGLGSAGLSADTQATWPSFGGAPAGGQYSSANGIDTENITRLTRAWTVRTGDVVHKPAIEGGTSFQATPVLWNDTLFVCTPLNRVLALDAASGEEVWTFDAHDLLPDEMPRVAGNCRGVAIAADPEAAQSTQACAARLYRGDVFGNLFAIDARTGKACSDFGDGGLVNFNAMDPDGRADRFLSSPASVVGNVVVVGTGVGDNMYANASDGIVWGLDATSGEVLWQFNPIPAALRGKTGGANVWSIMSVDTENGLVFLPTSSPSVDPYGAARTTPIPHANAVVALDAKTGEVAWSQQLVRHDLFDYDVPSQPILSNLTLNGQTRPVVIQITKMGFVFVFDRLTGEPVFALEEYPAPASDIPGETASPTQPVPTRPGPFARQSLTRDEVWGLTPIDRAMCRSQFDGLRNEGLYTPPSEQGTLQVPSALGGGNWGGAAYDPATSLLVVKTQNLASVIKLVPADPNEERPLGSPLEFLQKPLNETPYRLEGEFFVSPLGLPCTPPPWGEIIAIDLSAGEQVWRRPLGQIPVGPFALSGDWGSPNVGGPVLTGGGIVFIGAGMDNAFRAFDAETGTLLWEDDGLPAPAMSVPMTYEIDGTQYVVITAGGNALAGTELSDAIIAYKLGDRAEQGWLDWLRGLVGL